MSKRTKYNKNKIVNCGNYYEICLYNKQCIEIGRAKINKNDDIEKAKDYKWYINSRGYVVGKKSEKNIKLHQLILDKKEGFEIDHINHDKLDNRKQNLRHATHSQNLMNRGLQSNNASGYSGIFWSKEIKKWIVQIKVNQKGIHLGCFGSKTDAIKIRIQAERKYFKDFRYVRGIK